MREIPYFMDWRENYKERKRRLPSFNQETAELQVHLSQAKGKKMTVKKDTFLLDALEQ